MKTVKAIIKVLGRVLPHAVFILSLDAAVLLILHGFNPRMGFLTSSPSKIMLTALVIFAALQALVTIVTGSRNSCDISESDS